MKLVQDRLDRNKKFESQDYHNVSKIMFMSDKRDGINQQMTEKVGARSPCEDYIESVKMPFI
jgi:hypothetical protein